jgi:hypothetical protein
MPQLRSYSTTLGSQEPPTRHAIVVQARKPVIWEEGLIEMSDHHWNLPGDLIAQVRSLGLDALTSLTTAEKRTPFQRDILTALHLYSRSGLARDTEERLLYLFAALESILLRDDSESITQNISERLAFSIGADLETRKLIKTNAQRTYGTRSSFFHHGHPVEHEDSLSTFLYHVWLFFMRLITLSTQFKTTSELIESLEERKLA